MTLLGIKKAGLISLPKGTVFSVQGNHYSWLKQSQSPTNGQQLPSTPQNRANTVGGTRHRMVMPYGGKVLFIRVKRISGTWSGTVEIFKNNSITTMVTRTITSADNGTFVDSAQGLELTFIAGDEIHVNWHSISGLIDSADWQTGILYAFNVGSSSP